MTFRMRASGLPSRAIARMAMILIWIAAAAPLPAKDKPKSINARMDTVPGGGILPQLAADERFAMQHILYVKGDDGAGTIFAAKKSLGALANAPWSAPLQVNTRSRSVVASHAAMAPRCALSPDGRMHIVWLGSTETAAGEQAGGAGLFYTRSNSDVTAFEPQRQLLILPAGTAACPAIVVDPHGRVFLAWQASGVDSNADSARRLFATVSIDNGKTFASPTAIESAPLGVRGDCALEAAIDPSSGDLCLVFLTAGAAGEEHVALLILPTAAWKPAAADSGKRPSKENAPEAAELPPLPKGMSAILKRGERMAGGQPASVSLSMQDFSLAVAWSDGERVRGMQIDRRQPSDPVFRDMPPSAASAAQLQPVIVQMPRSGGQRDEQSPPWMVAWVEADAASGKRRLVCQQFNSSGIPAADTAQVMVENMPAAARPAAIRFNTGMIVVH